jgi:glycosyltransferase involved in cell wall biosynthesis
MFNICHISSVHPRYDIRIFEKECKTLAVKNKDVKVYLIVADGFGDCIKDGISIVDVGKPKSRFIRLFKIRKYILLKLKEIKPKIIHFHDPELLFIVNKCRKLGYKVIYDVHEDLPKQILNKHYIPNLFRIILSKLATFIEAKYSRNIDAIVCTTEIIAKRFKEYNKSVIVVCNYPLLSELKISNKNYSLRSNNICYIGSISRTRGVEYLIQSLANTNIKLELAGSFSGISYDDLKQLRGFENINYLGVLNRQEIVNLLNDVKIGVVTLLPTKSYIESLPIKMFEYMLAGIPIITSNFILWEDVVIGNNCGIMVDPINIIGIRNACEYLLNNPDVAENMGINGRNAVLSKYNWDIESVKLISLYHDLLI